MFLDSRTSLQLALNVTMGFGVHVRFLRFSYTDWFNARLKDTVCFSPLCLTAHAVIKRVFPSRQMSCSLDLSQPVMTTRTTDDLFDNVDFDVKEDFTGFSQQF